MGPFSLDDPRDYSVDVRVRDGGQPIQTSITKVAIQVCRVATWSKPQADHTRQTLLKVGTCIKTGEFISLACVIVSVVPV